MQPNLAAPCPKTILVVDDDPSILAFIAGFLRDDYEVLTASSGQEALQVAEDWTAELSLLLSDFEMPGMSGIELATQLNLARPKLKVLLMSGFPGGTLVLNEGWHFLSKPFVPSQLKALIRGLIFPDEKSGYQNKPGP